MLFRKGIGAPGNQDNLTRYVQPVEVTPGHGVFPGIGVAGGVTQENKGIVCACPAFVQALPAHKARRSAAHCGVGGIDLTHGQVGAGQSGIGHTGHRQSILIGAGAADGVNVRICSPVQICTCGALEACAIGVACGDGYHNVRLCEGPEQLLREGHTGAGRVYKAGAGGAQAQVDGVAAQVNGILNGSHIVIGISAAALAKHLHHQKLRFRGYAAGQHRLGSGGKAAVFRNIPVGRSNTGHMGSVVALGIMIVGNIQVPVYIVVAKGHFCIAVKVCRRQAVLGNGQPGQDLGNLRLVQEVPVALQLAQGIVIGCRVKGGVVQIQAGVDDGNAHPGAGVPALPGSVASHHIAGGHGHGRELRLAGLVDRDGAHLLHAGQGRNLLHGAVGHHGGNGVGHRRKLVAHLQRLFQNPGFNSLDHRLLPAQQAVRIGGSFRHGRGGVALLQGALAR